MSCGKLLDFHKEILNEVLSSSNNLLVMGQGLGLDTHIIPHVFNIFGDRESSQLVFVLNASNEEFEYFQEFIPNLKNVTSDFTSEERKEIYSDGGVLFVSTRILCVDFLNQKIPLNSISGLIILRAHDLTDTCNEAFILRLFREKNKHGFVKAFSEDAIEFGRGFGKLEKVMKLLFVDKVFLWPRFQVLVKECLIQHEPEVIEIEQQLTPHMKSIQDSTVKIMKDILTEIKDSNQSLDLSEFTVENCLLKNFEQMIKFQLRPIWNTIGSRTRQLLDDLKATRKLLHYLTKYDCVSFFNFLEGLRLSEGRFGIPKSHWMLTDEAQDIFYHAKERVYKVKHTVITSPSKKQKTLTQIINQTSSSKETVDDFSLGLNLEPNPKWSLLEQILEEIEAEITQNTNPLLNNTVIIFASDTATCTQIQKSLTIGHRDMLTKLMQRLIITYATSQVRSSEQPQREQQNSFIFQGMKNKSPYPNTPRGNAQKKQRGKKRSKKTSSSALISADIEIELLRQKFKQNEQKLEGKQNSEDDNTSFDQCFEIIKTDLVSKPEQNEDHKKANLNIFLYPFQRNGMNIISLLKPSFIIMYDYNISLIRKIEVFKACNPGMPLRIYFLMLHKSTEHQQYLSTLVKEKESFESLIKSKAKIVIPTIENILSNLEQSSPLSKDKSPTKSINTRRGGSALKIQLQTSHQRQIVVDVREFRSSLPSLLHQYGVKVIPIQLSVGDYILTNKFCVERKSLSDLWQSLNSGRLYAQCERMLRFYSHFSLLIEFTEDQPFILLMSNEYSDEISGSLITSKLALLTIHFPQLRILWSRSPHMTAKLFDAIKVQYDSQHKEPDPIVSQQIGTGEGEEEQSEITNQAIDFLKRLPGVHEGNVHKIMRCAKSLHDLSAMELPKLCEFMGKDDAERLFSFFQQSNGLL